jgi:hypothetical protein
VNSNQNNKIYGQASSWAEQLKSDWSFTGNDIEELKGHLIDLIEGLKKKGLDEDEAFMIASARLGDSTSLTNEFEEVNIPHIQMRRAILVLSGVFGFFLLYFLMLFIIRLLILCLYKISTTHETNFRIVVYFVIFCHFLIIVSTLYVYFAEKIKIKRLELLKIRPKLTYWLYLGIIVVAMLDLWLKMIIMSNFELGGYTSNHLYALFDYIGYSFPLIIIICFFVLYKRYYSSINGRNSSLSLNTKLLSQQEDDLIKGSAIQFSIEQHNNQIEDFKKIGLEYEEAEWIIQKRMGLQTQSEEVMVESHNNIQMRLLIYILSGIWVYFLLHFLLFSTTRVFFTVLQYFENDPLSNIKRTWSYVLIFQLLFIFLSISLYLRDNNIVKIIKRLNFEPIHIKWIFIAIIFFAFIDRCFYPISKFSLISDYNMKIKLSEVFLYTSYSFPFIICACFLMLFSKYYRDNVQIDN